MPQALQITRHRPGGVNHHIVVAHHVVKRPEYLGLRRQLLVMRPIALGSLFEPIRTLAGNLAAIIFGYPVISECFFQSSQRQLGVSHHHFTRMLSRIEGFHVDVYKAHIRVLELGVGSGSEVRVASTHPDHHIRFICQMVCAISAGRADAPDGAFMVIVDGAFTGLGIGYRNPGSARQIA